MFCSHDVCVAWGEDKANTKPQTQEQDRRADKQTCQPLRPHLITMMMMMMVADAAFSVGEGWTQDTGQTPKWLNHDGVTCPLAGRAFISLSGAAAPAAVRIRAQMQDTLTAFTLKAPTTVSRRQEHTNK